MANVINPYDPTADSMANDAYYYTSMATNGQLKRLQQKSSDFDYMNFLQSKDQIEFFTNFIFKKVGSSTINTTMKLMYIKKELRNIDWFFLSKSGMLQDDFITLILDKKWMANNGLILDSQQYIPIKIIHYLHPAQLCRTHNLTKTTDNIYFDDELNEVSSSSSSSDIDSSISQINRGMLFQKILRILHEDRMEYSQSALYEKNDNRNRYLENAKIRDVDFNDIQNQDGSITKVQPCVFDDFVQFIRTKVVHSQTKSSYYTPRFSEQEYLIKNVSEDCAYIGYNITIPKPILQFTTIDKKYMDLYHQLTWQYTDNEDGSTSTSSRLSTPKMYIADQYRNCGLDRISLLKYQDNLPLDFVCRYYTMDQLCQYYRFTSKQLDENSDGLIITYEDENNTDTTPFNLELLFMYNSFDMRDQHMINFYNKHKTKILNNSNIINSIVDYQKITNNGDIESEYSELSSYVNTSLCKLQINNRKFPKTQYFDQNKPTSDNYNYIQASDCIQQVDLLTNYTNNVLMTNCKEKSNDLNLITKKKLLSKIYKYSLNGNTKNAYYIYRQVNDLNKFVSATETNSPVSIIDEDQFGTFVNVCVRCHKQQFFFIDKGNAIQYTLRTTMPQTIQKIINKPQWNQNNSYSCVYYPSNNSCDNEGYIVCGMKDMLNCETTLKAKVYLKDIIALLDNGLLACSKVTILDNRLYYPLYKIGKEDNSSADVTKLYIHNEKFVNII